MPAPSALPLHEWESFYVIIGSSAAALTGLMFVVVALSAERRTITSPEGASGLTSFGTPTVVHFCAALLLAALMSTPGHTPRSLAACLLVMAVAGLLYVARALVRARRQSDYEPVLEDWVWHFILPFVAYGALLATGVAVRRATDAALYAVAAAELLLLFIGIHNAWDAAVWIAATGRREPASRDAKAGTAAPVVSPPPPAGK